MINEKWNIYYMIGSCYWGHSRANSLPQYILTPLDGQETYTLQDSVSNANPVTVYDWGNGLAGMSVHIPKNRTSGVSIILLKYTNSQIDPIKPLMKHQIFNFVFSYI